MFTSTLDIKNETIIGGIEMPRIIQVKNTEIGPGPFGSAPFRCTDALCTHNSPC